MASLKSFEEFEVWQNVRKITRRVYTLTPKQSFSAGFGLKNQIRKAAVNIMSNIAEGYERQTENIFAGHPGTAKGSTGEVRSQVYVALDQNCISHPEFLDFTERCEKTSRQITILINYLKSAHRQRPETLFLRPATLHPRPQLSRIL
jgi:four helix bundle protein